ncbi:Vacuole membrane protein 1 [Trichinella pseudospiralis]|uniref:Vacuole membrane protein 1 n=2 Tax=Trichinella pseudospiralis TaxID=6337 RepID=A0A0V1K321_TRIPS|nr:Vacuole membrane protein 1 [Trichinella pseudospiralis]KRY69960.1 Vacuole membrane protein 1 [Trichinella pseudospiralis]KRZ41628.1 Vacuole membrane protein 1 [Trichinella pseudospiralis]
MGKFGLKKLKAHGKIGAKAVTDSFTKDQESTIRNKVKFNLDSGRGSEDEGVFEFLTQKRCDANPDNETSVKTVQNYASASSGLKLVPSQSTLNRLERQTIVLHKKPFQTVNFCIRESGCLLYENAVRLSHHRSIIAALAVVLGLFLIIYHLPGQHQTVVRLVEKKLMWYASWIGLGILSSVGFGTGLHTFILYLGPHIASVTLAAFECGSLKFPEPPYPDEIICPDSTVNNLFNGTVENMNGLLENNIATTSISIWSIMSKVRIEAIMWGAGTALGELPPYFMARAARLSGQEPDDEDYREFKQFLEQSNSAKQQSTYIDKLKVSIERMIERVGFFAILLCASIPNPLFDLAGITCGHFLVPFWKFFGSTLIGKAIVKTHIQKFFVILAFSEHHFESALHLMQRIPKIGPQLEKPFREYLHQQKLKLHRRRDSPLKMASEIKESTIQTAFEILIVAMIGYFVISLVNSLAQNHHRRLWNRRKEQRIDSARKVK